MNNQVWTLENITLKGLNEIKFPKQKLGQIDAAKTVMDQMGIETTIGDIITKLDFVSEFNTARLAGLIRANYDKVELRLRDCKPALKQIAEALKETDRNFMVVKFTMRGGMVTPTVTNSGDSPTLREHKEAIQKNKTIKIGADTDVAFEGDSIVTTDKQEELTF